jgi:hypothetical protein
MDRLARYAVYASCGGIGSQRPRQGAPDVQVHLTAVAVTPHSDGVHGRNNLGSACENKLRSTRHQIVADRKIYAEWRVTLNSELHLIDELIIFMLSRESGH